MKVVKAISLDLETAQLAAEIPNFSLFVRNQLHAMSGGDTIADINNRVAVFNKALKLACEDYSDYMQDFSGNSQEFLPEKLYKKFIDKARKELFQTNLGDY
tara:strand:- start:204 stop:506 length:303 start_codon:yes stop_codon:yes gene_type:complete